MSDIVERLRNDDLYDAFNADTLCNEAADEIEKLRAENEHLATSNHAYLSGYQEAIAEIEKLREALRELIYETTHLSPQEDDGSHRCTITGETLRKARAALGEKE